MGVKQLVLSGTRIGVVTTDGTAHVKDGGLSAGWVTESIISATRSRGGV